MQLIYCGKPGDPATEQQYHQAIAEWLAAGKNLPAEPGGITVKEILARFWVHARDYYRTETDGRVKELEQFRMAIKPLKELYGESLATDFGPRAQKVLTPFLNRNSKAYCFSPAQAEADRRRKAHVNRTTPLSCGNTPGSNIKDNPAKSAGDRYTTGSYRRAIQRACDQAFQPPEPLAKRDDETWTEHAKRLTKKQKAEFTAWQKTHRWHPHQLRHNAATELRKEFGLEAARIILGHHSAAITEVYAEKDEQQAIEAISCVG